MANQDYIIEKLAMALTRLNRHMSRMDDAADARETFAQVKSALKLAERHLNA